MYDAILGMSWLEKNNAFLGCENKQVMLNSNMGTCHILQGEKRPLHIKTILTMQVKRSARKICKIFCAILFQTGDKFKIDINIKTVVQEFKDDFPEELNSLPPKWSVEHAIDLVLGAEPVSKAPYQQSIPELTELKIQLTQLLKEGKIRPSVSSWGAPVLFVK